jgi:hypothetical protein
LNFVAISGFLGLQMLLKEAIRDGYVDVVPALIAKFHQQL